MARNLVYKEAGGLAEMQGSATMSDHRSRLGWVTIKEHHLSRTFSYLGHIGRYADDRLEVKLLSSSIAIGDIEDPFAWTAPTACGQSIRSHYRRCITMVINKILELASNKYAGEEHIEIDEEAAIQQWRHLGTRRRRAAESKRQGVERSEQSHFGRAQEGGREEQRREGSIREEKII